MKRICATGRFRLESLEARRLLSFSPAVSYPTGPAPLSVANGDFNGDARPDLVVYNSNSTISVLLGNPNGTFQPALVSPGGGPGPDPLPYGGPSPFSIAVGDFNRDGKLDLVTNSTLDGVSVSLGNGDGTFRAPARVSLTIDAQIGDYYPVSVAVGDVNGDGKLDLAVAFNAYAHDETTGDTMARVVLGRGDGSFQPAQWSSIGGEYPISACVTVADFNGDGKSDVVTAIEGDGGTRRIVVILGAAGGLGSVFYSYVPDVISSIAARDMNGDGKLDLVVVGYRVNVLLGTGTGAFSSLEESATPTGQSTSVVTADFNGDGKVDIATVDYQSGTVNVQLGTGTGTFGPPLPTPSGTGARGLTVGDFNSDGRADVASANAGSGDASALLNDGNWGGVKTWIGPASGGDWSTAGNWSPGGAPTASDLVTIAGKSVTLGASATVANLTLSGGATLVLTPNGDRVLRALTLSISSNSKLNLNDNNLILDYTPGTATPMAGVLAKLDAGRDGAAGSIYSPGGNASAGLYALAAAEARDVLRITGAQTGILAGQIVDTTAVLVRYTVAGDATFDRVVNFDDLLILAKSYNGTDQTWAHGDFTGDGTVNFNDLLILAKNYNKGLPVAAPRAVEMSTAVPASATPLLCEDDTPKAVFSTKRVGKPIPAKPAPAKPRVTAKPNGR